MTHLRGGSWNNSQNNARSAYRNNNHPDNRNNNIGFRLGLVGVRPTSPSLFNGARAWWRVASRPFLSRPAASRNAG
ncbi:MAG: SUMF1/EgtB/PvdO family nonheme iron enzyme [Aggregatilineales bacterium]